ncbi:MAG TPA: hypothetical protein VJV79_08365 [Polyangiaceae bacterium]|nr:hypothetical protein [Polyangiaceae bacterium]
MLTPALACSGTAARPGTRVPPSNAPDASSAPRTNGPTTAKLERAFTGQPQPSLLVSNGFPVAQHVFVDWVHQARLAPASSQRFQLTIGTHTVTCADSADPDHNPAAITESFEAGYAYAYAIRPIPD